MPLSQDMRAAGKQNWANFQGQTGQTSQADWDADLQHIRATYGDDPQSQARALATRYLNNMNASQYLSPQVRKWIVQRAPLGYMQSTMDTLTGQDSLTANQMQGGMDWKQFGDWLNSANAGIDGYNPAMANQKWAVFQQRMADAFNPNSTMDAGTRGIWQNMDEQDFLDYQRMLMKSTLAPSLYAAADDYLTNAWTNNQLSPIDQQAPYRDWVKTATGNPLFNTRW